MALLQTFWRRDRLVRCEALQVGRLAVQTRKQAPQSYCSSLCWLLTAPHCTCIFTISGELHGMQQDSRITCPSQMWSLEVEVLGIKRSSDLTESDHPMSHLGASVEIGEAIDNGAFQSHLSDPSAQILTEKQNQAIPSKVVHECMRYKRLLKYWQ